MASPPEYALISTFRPIKVLMVEFQKKDLDKKKSSMLPMVNAKFNMKAKCHSTCKARGNANA